MLIEQIDSPCWSIRVDTGRGYLRQRLAVPACERDADRSAWQELSDAFLTASGIEWLNPLYEMVRADNKLYQAHLASTLGVPIPRTVVADRVQTLKRELGDHFVIKALGTGTNRYGSSTRVLYATNVRAADLIDAELAAAPVLAQEYLRAELHLRVVTVAEECVMCSRLPSANLDWREDRPGDSPDWHSMSNDSVITTMALLLASRAGLGFTSQDWILTDHGPYFLDLNPNGKWLFLPSSTTESIARQTATWLTSS